MPVDMNFDSVKSVPMPQCPAKSRRLPVVLVVCARDCRGDPDWAALAGDGYRILHVNNLSDALAVLVVEPRLEAVAVQGVIADMATQSMSHWLQSVAPAVSVLIGGHDSSASSVAKIRALGMA